MAEFLRVVFMLCFDLQYYTLLILALLSFCFHLSIQSHRLALFFFNHCLLITGGLGGDFYFFDPLQ